MKERLEIKSFRSFGSEGQKIKTNYNEQIGNENMDNESMISSMNS